MQRYFRWLTPMQIQIIVFIGILVMSTVGFRLSAPSIPVGDSLYKAVQLFGLNYDVPAGFEAHWFVLLGRILAPILTIVALVELLSRRFVGWIRNVLQARDTSRIVLIGFGHVNRAILRRLQADVDCASPITVVDRNFSAADQKMARRSGVLLLEADPTDASSLNRLLPARAQDIYVACGADSVNLEIGTLTAKAIEDATAAKPGHIKPAQKRRYGCGHTEEEAVHVHVASPKLMEDLARAQDISFPLGSGMTFFSLKSEIAATLVSRARFADRAQVLTGHSPHLVIYGAGELAEAIVIQSLVAGLSISGIPRFTIVDPDRDTAKAKFVAHYPRLFDRTLKDLAEPDIDFLKADAQLLCFETNPMLADLEADPDRPTAWIFAGRDGEENISAALRLENAMQMQCRKPVPIYARVWQGQLGAHVQHLGLTHLFGQGDDPAVCDRILSKSNDWFARQIHTFYRSKKQGDPDTAANHAAFVDGWRTLPEHVRRSNLWAAMHLPQLVADLGFDWRKRHWGLIPVMPDVPALAQGLNASTVPLDLRGAAETEHRRWMIDRAINGWQVGPRDNRRRKHENLIDFDLLSDETKQLDLTTLRMLLDMPLDSYPYDPPNAKIRRFQELDIGLLAELAPDTTTLTVHLGGSHQVIDAGANRIISVGFDQLSHHENICHVCFVIHGEMPLKLNCLETDTLDVDRTLTQWLAELCARLPTGVSVDLDYDIH